MLAHAPAKHHAQQIEVDGRVLTAPPGANQSLNPRSGELAHLHRALGMRIAFGCSEYVGHQSWWAAYQEGKRAALQVIG